MSEPHRKTYVALVADRLRARDITGEQGNAFGCPLSVVIRTAMPEIDRVIVGSRYALLRINDQLVKVTLPAAASEFVARFDDGIYLDLVTPAVTR
jgi:hypothetical protein